MKRPHVLLQIVALISSGMLAGGFVSYQAGAFSRLTAPREQPAQPAGTPAVEEKPSDGGGAPSAPTIMSSSKVGTITFIGKLTPPSTPEPQPPAATEPPPGTPKPMPAIMLGTKSAPIFVPPSGTSKPEPPPPTPPQPAKSAP